jgi:histidinol-phosphate/aromatic aminotransferase/cobyric acid decarboxylase-like protein
MPSYVRVSIGLPEEMQKWKAAHEKVMSKA